MSSILDIPPELLNSIFEYLGTADLVSLLKSQRVCRRFQSASRHALHYLATHPTATEAVLSNAVIQKRFSWILNYTPKGTGAYYGDCPESAFRKLPWAMNPVTRAQYLRPEASWRSLSVTWGSLPVKQLEIINLGRGYRRANLDYFYIDVPVSGLTLGAYYDLLLSNNNHYVSDLARWRLMIGVRLSAYDALRELNTGRYISRDQVIGILVADAQASQAAVLFAESLFTCAPEHRIRREDQGSYMMISQETLGCSRNMPSKTEGPNHASDSLYTYRV